MNKKRQASQIRKEKYKELLDLGGIIGTYITFKDVYLFLNVY